eukprot:5168866-Alexandrium_andersonii.AAC.1
MSPPSALGKHRASLAHKLRSIVHAIHLEYPDARSFCHSVRGNTTDFGTEIGLGFVALDGSAQSALRSEFKLAFVDDSDMRVSEGPPDLDT